MLADSGLNYQAETLVNAQTQIKLAVKSGVIRDYTRYRIFSEMQRIISAALKKIESPTLKRDAERSLWNFALKCYNIFKDALGNVRGGLLLAIISYSNAMPGRSKLKYYQVIERLQQTPSARFFDYDDIYGSIKHYFKRVKDACTELAKQYALDPNDFTGRNSLRNLAEMQVRYERHLQQIADYKARGINIVVCSVHSDCSERCRPWQGRIYSLDGTSGMTEDGKPYIPLERATDIYYTTKAGRTYKNGLLGFNCRHKLYEYKPGMQIPTVSHAEQQKQYAIDKRQRELEREVLRLREDALMQRGIDKKAYTRLAEHAREKNREYIVFSRKNGRKYFPDRTKLLFKPSRNDQ